MCGIVGYLGSRQAAPILLDSLSGLEYRGYDSAGVAVIDGGKLDVVKRLGKLSELVDALDAEKPAGNIGIGHTRWATHGAPSQINAHPHLDCKEQIAVVHNGIIENFQTLKEDLIMRGHTFRSETDTEVLAHLIETYYDGNLEEAIKTALTRVEGSYALAVISPRHPDTIIAARKDSPMIVGLGDKEFFLASDIPAVLGYTKKVLVVEDNETVIITKDKVVLKGTDGKEITRKPIIVTWDAGAAEKAGFDDFMLKEIFEQPTAIRETMRGRVNNGKIILDELRLTEKEIRAIDKVFIVACGTSYHAGMVAKYAIESWVRIPVEIDIASEFRYRNPILDDRTLLIAVSQSGETADTLAGMRYAREQGAKTMAITNVVGSTISREADGVLYTHAGPEIGVAATKTLVAQIIALYLVSLYLSTVRRSLSVEDEAEVVDELYRMDEIVTDILEDKKLMDVVKDYAEKHADKSDFLFIGRSVGYPVALEGALKMKEISYIHAEGYAAGELKHGPIALVEASVPIVAVATEGHVYDKVISNIMEVKARDANVLVIASRDDAQIAKIADEVIYVPRTSEILSAVPAVVPLQLISYYIAKHRGCNVDQPRNLAKSVTVE